MSLRNRARADSAQRRTTPIWVWPTGTGVVAFAAATVLTRVDIGGDTVAQLAWPGDVDAASTLVQTVAGSVVTVTTLTFTLTVVALQLASQQFSPRLLREFTRDRLTRVVLSVLVGTFVFSLSVLRHLRSDGPPPALAMLVVGLTGLASLAALLAFITHIVRILRVDTMMLAVHDETKSAIRTFYPRYGDERPEGIGPDTQPTGECRVVLASESGFVRQVDVSGLVQGAAALDVLVRLMVRPGDHLVTGSVVATVWNRGGGPPSDNDAVDRLVAETVLTGYERTLEQDAAFGFRQLTDIAVKALSPGINDPVTAAHAIGHMADLLAELVGCRLGATVHQDEHGVGRAVVPDRDLPYYLELCCGQIRRYGSREPTVLCALLAMLRDVAASARDDHQRKAIVREAGLVVASMESSLLAEDRARVDDMVARVDAALEGRLVDAYADRSGETRST